MLSGVVENLRSALQDLGAGGGRMSASVYDTAQAARLSPAADTRPALEWLLAQQQADGAFGEPTLPLARDSSTLAALLALSPLVAEARFRDALGGARTFLASAAERWSDALPEGLPVGVEVIVTALLRQADAAGIVLPEQGFQALVRAAEGRLPKLRRIPAQPGSPAAFTFEAWGREATPEWLDELGSVATNPAASAGWLRLARPSAGLRAKGEATKQYLARAAATTNSAAGVMPSAWPIERFELAFGLLPLVATGLLGDARLTDVLEPQLDVLEGMLGPGGIGHSRLFAADVDDTAAAMAVLAAAGRSVDWTILDRFRTDDHFVTYPGESHASITATARAVFALRVGGRGSDIGGRFFAERREPDGRFTGDKWNSSWLYTTWSVLLALPDEQASRATLESAASLFVARQLPDGGWGSGLYSNASETAYALLALHELAMRQLTNEHMREARQRGHAWLRERHRRGLLPFEKVWICKELYSVPRIDAVFALSALLSSEDTA
jgi:hypothetical protein